MENLVIMLMEKNLESGFLEKEVGSYTVEKYGELIDKIFLVKDNDKEIVHIRVTVDKDVEDWEYSAIYDEYSPQALEQFILTFDELEDTYNPIWELSFEFLDNQSLMEKKINNILSTHKKELDKVWANIADKKSDYE